jgi:hypothetical protein
MPRTSNPAQGSSVLSQLEAARNSKVIAYFTSTKPAPFGAVIASDVLPHFRVILESFEKPCKKISLVLNTSGGHLEVPWPLVNLVREYCKFFEVIVLEKALSAGTLIALGADRIVMLPYSQLSPVDPAADIVDSGKPVKHFEIEDIIGYIDFAKDKVGIAEQNALAEITKELTKEISPTILGSVNRTHALIRRVAKSLLELRVKRLPDKQVKEIVENLTSKLYSHRHMINRKEARDTVGFESVIEFANDTTKGLCDTLLVEMATTLRLNKDFNPAELLGSAAQKSVELIRAQVFSIDKKYDFISSYHLQKVPDPSGAQQFSVNSTSNKWVANE